MFYFPHSSESGLKSAGNQYFAWMGFRRHDEIFSDMDTIVRPHEVCKGHRAKEIEDSLIGEFRAAVRMEVEHGKRDSLPDERRIRFDEAGV